MEGRLHSAASFALLDELRVSSLNSTHFLAVTIQHEIDPVMLKLMLHSMQSADWDLAVAATVVHPGGALHRATTWGRQAVEDAAAKLGDGDGLGKVATGTTTGDHTRHNDGKEEAVGRGRWGGRLDARWGRLGRCGGRGIQ